MSRGKSQPFHSNNQSLNLSRWLPAIGIEALLPGNWALVERKDDKCLSNLKGVLLDRQMDIYSWYFDKNVSRSVWDSGRCTETDSGQWLHSMARWELHLKTWESYFMYSWFFPPYSLKDITGVISVLMVICSDKKCGVQSWAAEVTTFLNTTKSYPLSNMIVVNILKVQKKENKVKGNMLLPSADCKHEVSKSLWRLLYHNQAQEVTSQMAELEKLSQDQGLSSSSGTGH